MSTSQAGSWFSKFPPFLYDPTAGLKSNFDRLAADRKWGKKLQKKRWAECQEEEFGHAYGSDFTKLEAWQNLCIEVYIINPPDSIKQCKNVGACFVLRRQLLKRDAGSRQSQCTC